MVYYFYTKFTGIFMVVASKFGEANEKALVYANDFNSGLTPKLMYVM